MTRVFINAGFGEPIGAETLAAIKALPARIEERIERVPMSGCWIWMAPGSLSPSKAFAERVVCECGSQLTYDGRHRRCMRCRGEYLASERHRMLGRLRGARFRASHLEAERARRREYMRAQYQADPAAGAARRRANRLRQKERLCASD